MKVRFNILLIIFLCLVVGFAFSFSPVRSGNPKPKKESKKTEGRIDGYNLLGTNYVYYKIPQNLSREDLIAAAQRIYESEPDANLILVDDDSKVSDYIKYAKVINPGYEAPQMPKEWADKHIVATIRKDYWSGKIFLYEGCGNQEITELK